MKCYARIGYYMPVLNTLHSLVFKGDTIDYRIDYLASRS